KPGRITSHATFSRQPHCLLAVSGYRCRAAAVGRRNGEGECALRVSGGSVFARCGCRDGATGLQLAGRCQRRGQPGHGSWYFAFDVPGECLGQRCRIRRGGYGSRAEAVRALRRLTPGAGQRSAIVTVGQWLTAWLDARITVRASTRSNYASTVAHHLRPHLGRVPLAELSARDVEVMLRRIVRAGGPGGHQVSMATLHRVLACLRTALNAAVREGLMSSNPASQVRLARSRRPSALVWTAERVDLWRRTGWCPAVAVWTAPQTAAFLTFIRDHRLYAAFHLIALRGLRRGEAAGLRWVDLDLANKTALISFQNQ